MQKHRNQEDNRYCLTCGYLLRGLPDPRCPECGRPFDPTDASTYGSRGYAPALAAHLRRPPGWPLLTVSALCIVLVVTASDPTFAWLVLVPAAVVLLCRILLLGLTLCFYPGLKVADSQYEVLRWLSVAALLAATVMLSTL